jgi:hypothetical protein
MKIFLSLGCWGREKYEFVSCPGVTNRILDITRSSECNTKIADYLDSHFRLFDRPLYNNVHTVVWNIQDKFSEKGKPVFQENKFRYIEEFCIDHSKCGIFLRLELEEEEE